jgi:kynurenine formamidase
MLIDLTVVIDKQVVASLTVPSKLGHLGTHFDVMGGEFPLKCVKRVGRLVDISAIKDREVGVADIASSIEQDEFVIFRTNYAADIGYGGPDYNHKSAELSDDVVSYLLECRVSLIGVDAASIQRPAKHREVDERCAAQNVFVVENLCNLETLANAAAGRSFTVYCAPLNFRGLTGIPCRVVAEVTSPVDSR